MSDKKYFDAPVPEKYLTQGLKYKEHLENMPLVKYFNKENNKEFYCGMVAGFRAALTLLQSMPPKLLETAFTEGSIICTVLANEKS